MNSKQTNESSNLKWVTSYTVPDSNHLDLVMKASKPRLYENQKTEICCCYANCFKQFINVEEFERHMLIDHRILNINTSSLKVAKSLN